MGAFDTIHDVRSPVRIRGVNVLLGVWLFASAFLWPHQDNVAFNDWVVGVVVAASALCAVWAPPFRWVNAGAAVWLGFSALEFVYHSTFTRLHDLVLAVAIFAIALVRLRTAPAGEPQAIRTGS